MPSTFAEDALEGRRALVTGGGTGLGRAMTEAFLEHGADVAIASRSKYEKAAEELSIPGFELDVRDPETCEQVADAAADELGGLDLVVNNAAGNFLSPATNLSEGGWDAVTGIVLDGTFNVSKAASEHLFEAEDGRVINIVATYAWTAAPFVSHSGAAKAGVLNLTRSLALEWGDEDVRVNAIAPGPVATEKASEHLGYADPEVQQRMSERIPLGRLGEPEDVGEAAVFLASPAARWVSGECLVVDGGQWLVGNLFDSLTRE
jgi:NAD(P)-dependent dehydrogenase (short-subunit alcohol dehydrogenase family)